ncbi:MAG: DNA topoisomerase, partial [bacterium]
MASQMAPALFDATVVDVLAARLHPAPGAPLGDARFRANGSVERFAGFLAAYRDSRPNSKSKEGKQGGGGDREEGDAGQSRDGEGILPPLALGEVLRFLGGAPEQHFTQAPPRYNDAGLVKMLEERGIGRPSTYAAIISTILDRLYVERIEGGRLQPTELGRLTNQVLVRFFQDVLDVDFTARLEEQLDQVAEGLLPWRKAVGDFYAPFVAELEAAKVAIGELKAALVTETVAGVFCEKCGAAMAVKWGRLGKFLACPNYPTCKSTRPLARGLDGGLKAAEKARTDEVCPKCGRPMEVKQGRFGAFLACGGYPGCKCTKPMTSGPALPCP